MNLKTAFRSHSKSKSFGILNIAGLAIGIACASLIFLWVEDEVTFNQHFARYNKIFQVMENQLYNGSLSTIRATPGPLADGLRREIPGIRASARIAGNQQSLFSLGDKSIYQTGDHVDSAFFSMFTPEFVEGDPRHVFDQLYSIVITEDMAHKFFGEGPALGQTLKMENKDLYTVTGVIRRFPDNSFIKADWLAPFELIVPKFDWLTRWDANGVQTIVELEENVDVASIDRAIYGFLGAKKKENDAKLFLLPMSDWHLHNSFTNGKPDGKGQIKFVRLFAIIAVLVLVIACVNFMNLATARSEQRAKEVGVRKTLGAGRRRLILQFIGEALTMSFAAVLLATIIVYLTLPAFNTLVGKDLSLDPLKPLHTLGLAGIALLSGLLAGSYPAFYLSSFNAALVLKGVKIKSGGGASFIRQGLVTAQFVVSITLIICTVVIYQQVQHTKGRNLGYSKDQLFYVDVRGKIQEHFNAVKTSMINTGYVENAAMSVSPLIQAGWWSSDSYTWQGKDPNKDVIVVVEAGTPEYVSTMGLKLIEGRDFYPDAKNDFNNVIINKTMANTMGMDNAVGAVISQKDWKMTVVGVVDDFVYGNMYSSKPNPMILICNPANYNVMTVRLKKSADVHEAMAKIETTVRSFNPGYPFEYHFVDEEFDKQFRNEALIEKLAGVFASLAIFISCLGLYGLSAYTASRRTKEISIRKVLGASVQGLTGLLSKDFLKLVAMACVISFPASWYIMSRWLSSFEYRTPIYWWVFALTGATAIIIALMTVSVQTIKAATIDPARSLRKE